MNQKFIYIIFSILFVLLLAPSISDAHSFKRNLKQGDRGEDVLLLQKILNADSRTSVAQSGPGSSGSETTYFGPATKRAVIAFQELYADEILILAGLARANGFVGTLTRQKLDAIQHASAADGDGPIIMDSHQNMNLSSGSKKTISTSTNSVSTTSTSTRPIGGINQSLLSKVPVITSLASDVIQNGDKIIIYGRNFQPKNTIFVSIELPGKYVDVPAISSTSTEIVFSSTIAEDFKKSLSNLSSDAKSVVLSKVQSQMSKDTPYKDGWYMSAVVSLKNEYGVSNAVPIKINILKGV